MSLTINLRSYDSMEIDCISDPSREEIERDLEVGNDRESLYFYFFLIKIQWCKSVL